MSVINILDKSIYNKIAAGEVVEKPASVVKELVENCIDAGATNIVIDILEGGIKQIKVSDNGCGIAYDDFDKVFLAHATSKISSIDDLGKIGTLGFRGEALSSIASVSKITLSSKTENSEEGYQVKVDGGEMGDILPIGATAGTYIVVEDLFFNIPARKKFLRKPKLEENDITNYVARLIMANPNISIKYSADNKIVYHSYGNGLYDAIYAIYGKSIVDNIFEFDFKYGDYSFSGYLGKPTFSKPNRTYQTLIINGRYVVNQTISTAIYKSYENFIMKGMFPFFVINLNVPLDKVDVNVHPNKLDVKFEDSNSVFGMVYSGVTELLYNVDNTKIITVEDEKEPLVDEKKLETISVGSVYVEAKQNDEIVEVSLSNNDEYEINKITKENNEFTENILKSESRVQIDGASFIPFVSKKSAFDFKVESSNMDVLSLNTEKSKDTDFDDLRSDGFNNLNIDNVDKMVEQERIQIDQYKIVGSIFNTYIIVEDGDSILLIDQHAAHERLLFDSFMKELDKREVVIQSLLVPYVLDANYQESAFINENIDILNEMGFDIEEFGSNSYKISTIPLLFDDFKVDEFFNNILKDIDNKLVLSDKNTMKDYVAKTACKSAVKGNNALKDNEIRVLLSNLRGNDKVLLCPHGRPIVVEVSNKEIQKWFKRIV